MNPWHPIVFPLPDDSDHHGDGVLRSFLPLAIPSLRAIAILHLILINLLLLIIY
jgi:hypothetical protein